MVLTPAKCSSCRTQECAGGSAGEIGACTFGFNFVKLADNVVANGFIIPTWQNPTKSFKKNSRLLRDLHVTNDTVTRLVLHAAGVEEVSDSEFRRRKEAALAEYRASDEFERDSVSLLRPEIQQSLSQVHDYRSLVGQIVQNVNVLLDARGSDELDRKLGEAPRELQAIYWSARLMESKLTAALYLMYPERIRDPSKVRRFRLHGLVTKYEKIYEGAFEDRSVRISFAGSSFGDIRANPDAVGVIPHTLIDNALKYAPSDTSVTITFSESDHEIAMTVDSLGPRIHSDELQSIFHLYVRGRDANAVQREGTGFGLALAKHVADELGVSLTVRQERESERPGSYRTFFTAVFPKA